MTEDDDDQTLPWPFETEQERVDFSTQLTAMGLAHTDLVGDDYDCSIDIVGVAPDFRCSPDVQAIILKQASTCRLRHTDGWQTHYNWYDARKGERVFPSRGWRRRYVSDPSATTTNVLGGPPNPGYYEISFWPESWGTREWLATGYMRIVPDALEITTPPST